MLAVTESAANGQIMENLHVLRSLQCIYDEYQMYSIPHSTYVTLPTYIIHFYQNIKTNSKKEQEKCVRNAESGSCERRCCCQKRFEKIKEILKWIKIVAQTHNESIKNYRRRRCRHHHRWRRRLLSAKTESASSTLSSDICLLLLLLLSTVLPVRCAANVGKSNRRTHFPKCECKYVYRLWVYNYTHLAVQMWW